LQSYNSVDEFSMLNTFMTIVVFLSNKINPYKTLEEIGVVPGDDKSYPIHQFIDVFNKKYNLSNCVIPVCLRQKSSGEDYLSELRFCLDLNYEPIECDPVIVMKHIKYCGEDPVLYPALASPE
jgi:hypothetical protein